MTDVLAPRLAAARRKAVLALLAEQGSANPWTGELSSSALSTATAVTALATVDRRRHHDRIQSGLRWLAAHVNADGGWGDTIRSRSNPSTTALVWAAFGAAEADAQYPETVARAAQHLERTLGPIEQRVPALEALYGRDRTFSVPITMTLALSGRLGPDGWHRVRPLPFELAALPRGLFGALRLPVVSYALPALIAIGQVIHHRSGRRHPLRSLARARTLEVLTTLQPAHGGFLEATPLTSFVTMSLAGMGLAAHPVARRGEQFLVHSARADGSWPIDTNLATWVTTLSIKALHQALPAGTIDADPALAGAFDADSRHRLRTWLLDQQHRVVHPYTGAAPGGWAWTNLPGGVPDADDTAGALLALHGLAEPAPDPTTLQAAADGVAWLLGLQNLDGGIPTFCRGWGTLPFDRSSPELTAHALRAWSAWLPHLRPGLADRTRIALRRGWAFLERRQRADGAWSPLWFGNEAAPAQDNPVYGTSVVLQAFRPESPIRQPLLRALQFLRLTQHPEGGWGGDAGVAPSLEETALALAALAGRPGVETAVNRGAHWLLDRLEGAGWQQPAPIGLYFARLWYFERLYPLIFVVDALGRLCRETAGTMVTPPSRDGRHTPRLA